MPSIKQRNPGKKRVCLTAKITDMCSFGFLYLYPQVFYKFRVICVIKRIQLLQTHQNQGGHYILGPRGHWVLGPNVWRTADPRTRSPGGHVTGGGDSWSYDTMTTSQLPNLWLL